MSANKLADAVSREGPLLSLADGRSDRYHLIGRSVLHADIDVLLIGPCIEDWHMRIRARTDLPVAAMFAVLSWTRGITDVVVPVVTGSGA
jgi:hypothetical protein